MTEKRAYQICTRCIMDTSDPDITFNAEGVCNHCTRYTELIDTRVFQGDEAREKLEKLVSRIKKDKGSAEYDCIIGVSGGVDSTYVAYLAKKLGLNPLAIHFDNGWNSELAVSNIEKTLDKLNIDLYTYVIDWEEFKNLQLSFLYASTPDGEVPTDHAINALLFKEASKRGIKYIINGMNFATESLAVKKWAYGHSDWKYISDVHKRFGSVKLKRYPYYTFLDLFYYTFIRGVKVISILNYIPYNKKEVMKVLQDELGWVYYGGKHYESVYTRFYQAYILPRKFNIDKRRGHLSDLVHAGQLTRAEALELIKEPVADMNMLEQDKDFVIKKLDLDPAKFEAIMQTPPTTYESYNNSEKSVMRLKKIVNWMRRKGIYSK